MDSTDDQVQRVLNAWDDSTDEANYAGVLLSEETRQVLARQAVEALQCGEPHPDRDTVRCTQLPHGTGHLYHRNSGLGLEWWVSDDATHTVHDALGPIHLGQPQASAEPQEVPCPECRWSRQDGRYHDRLIGGWLRCAHCGHEWNGPESRPSSWCRARHPEWDVYCDTLHHPLSGERHTLQHASSTYRIRWTDGDSPLAQRTDDQRGRYHTLPPCEDDTELADPPKCGTKHDQYDWYCDRDVHDVTGDDPSTWHRDRTRDRYWYPGSDIALSVAGGNDADRAVYRDLFPILDYASAALYRIANTYRDGKPRITAEMCRTAEDNARKLAKSSTMLQEMTGTGTDDHA